MNPAAGQAESPLVEARGLEVEIAGTRILRGADLSLSRGELLAVVGPNGAGKSTLVRAVSGLQPYSAGDVRWSGRVLPGLKGRELAHMRAFVPQRMPVPAGVEVREAVTIGRSSHLRPLRRLQEEDHDAVEASLERAGIQAFAERQLSTLSGGEMQRVQIAIGLAQEAPVLIADEPTSQLDLGAAVGIAGLLRGLADDGLAVLLVVHDLALATAVADRVVVVADGRTVAEGEPGAVLSRELLASVWHADARLTAEGGHTALHVAWLPGQGVGAS